MEKAGEKNVFPTPPFFFSTRDIPAWWRAESSGECFIRAWCCTYRAAGREPDPGHTPPVCVGHVRGRLSVEVMDWNAAGRTVTVQTDIQGGGCELFFFLPFFFLFPTCVDKVPFMRSEQKVGWC